MLQVLGFLDVIKSYVTPLDEYSKVLTMSGEIFETSLSSKNGSNFLMKCLQLSRDLNNPFEG